MTIKDIISVYIKNNPKNIIRLAYRFGVSAQIVENWASGLSIPPKEKIRTIIDFITEELINPQKNPNHYLHQKPPCL